MESEKNKSIPPNSQGKVFKAYLKKYFKKHAYNQECILYIPLPLDQQQNNMMAFPHPIGSKEQIREFKKKIEKNFKLSQQFQESLYIVRNQKIFQVPGQTLVQQGKYDTTLDEINITSLTYKEKLLILQSVGEAIKQLHNKLICHRFIQPFSVTLRNQGSKNLKIKLNCFTRYYALSSRKQKILEPIQSFSLFLAPQIRSKQPYDLSSDIWSLGALFYWLVFGTIDKLAKVSLQNPVIFPDNTPKWLMKIIGKLLEFDPNNRQNLQTFLDVIKAAFICAIEAEKFIPKIPVEYSPNE